jgi:hypothetical protein
MAGATPGAVVLHPWKAHLVPWKDYSGRTSALKLVVFAALFVPALWTLLSFYLGWLQPQPYTAAIRQIGLWTIRLVFIALAITPLRSIVQWPRLILVRRMVGVAAFAYAITHLTLYIADQKFDLAKIAGEIALRIYLTIGFTAVIGLGALALGADHHGRHLRLADGLSHAGPVFRGARPFAACLGRRARSGRGGFDGARRGGFFLGRLWG